MRSAFLLATTFLTVAACSNAPEAKIPEATGPQTLSEEIMLADFDEGQKPDFVRVNNGSVELVPSHQEGGSGHDQLHPPQAHQLTSLISNLAYVQTHQPGKVTINKSTHCGVQSV